VGGSCDEDEKVPKKALKGYIEGRRPVGRSRGRWLDAVDRDAKRMQGLEKVGRGNICLEVGD
jgi:hypothetical protein